MSGRDLRAFITNHRTEDNTRKHLLWMKDGNVHSKSKPTKYEQLQSLVETKRQESEIIGQKVQRTLLAARTTKENAALRQHRQVWATEYLRLAGAEEKAGSDLQNFVGQLNSTSGTDADISTLRDHSMYLEKEQEVFMNATVEPVLQLSDDLRFRLNEVLHHHIIPHPSDLLQIEQQVNVVKGQQVGITEKLHAECVALEEEIAALGLEECLSGAPSTEADVEPVPAEVLNADCPYPELKHSLVQTFHSLSERYQSKLQSLRKRLRGIDRCCGWSADDHLCFQLTVGQYAHDMPNRKALYMDMLQRLFPQRSRQELMEHERVWDWQRFTRAQLRVVAQSWQRDREEMLARALVVLEEAQHAQQEELDLHRARRHQREVCTHLREKVQQCQAQQEEVLRLEAAIAARRQEEEEERLSRKRENEAAIRSQQSDKLKQFYLKQRMRRELLERRDQERLAQLRSVMEEQARRDKERVQVRGEMLQHRRQEREAMERERQRAQEERQNHLRALRAQVAVVVEADPERMMGETEAWRSRQQNNKEGFELHRPLYNINTYTDSQIVSDPRVRLEQALRDAGLQQSQYAKQILSDIKPPKPPRRDTLSAVLKY